MRWQKILLLLTLLFTLTGCGAAEAKAASPTAPTILEVTRTSALPQQHLPSFRHITTDAGAVQRLYAAAQKQPKAGIHNWMCLVRSTIVYHVRFLSGKTVVQQWDLDAVGCYAIMLHKGDLRQPNAAFVSLFAKTIGLTRLY